MATINKRKDGLFRGRIELGKDENGKRKRHYIYDNSEKRLKQRIAEIENDINKGRFVLPSSMTYPDFVDIWFKTQEGRIEDTTYRSYQYNVDKIKAYFKGVKLQDIKPINISAFYSELLKTLSKNTVRKVHGIVKKSMEQASINKLIYANPVIGVEVPRKEKFKPKAVSTEKFETLLSATNNTFWEMPIALAALLGMRRGEILALKWSDVDLENKVLYVKKSYAVKKGCCEFKDTKNDGSYRRIIIQDSAIDIFNRYKEWQKRNRGKNWTDNEMVVSYLNGNPYRPDGFSVKFKEMLEHNGVPHMRFHDLRHFNATMMLKLGISDKVAAERLGHSQVSTLHEIYQHVITDMELEAAEKLNGILGGSNGGSKFKKKRGESPLSLNKK